MSQALRLSDITANVSLDFLVERMDLLIQEYKSQDYAFRRSIQALLEKSKTNTIGEFSEKLISDIDELLNEVVELVSTVERIHDKSMGTLALVLHQVIEDTNDVFEAELILKTYGQVINDLNHFSKERAG